MENDLTCPVKPIRKNIVVRAGPQTQSQLVCPVKRLVYPVKRLDPEDDLGAFDAKPLQENDGYSPYFKRIFTRYKHKKHFDYSLMLPVIEADENCEWVSEFLADVVFSPGSYNFLAADPGLGKTTFVEVDLPKRFTRILYVTNRIDNREQFEFRNRGNLRLTVISYQKLENDVRISGKDLDYFQIAVFDEYQYILEDSGFSSTTGITVRKIMESKTCIKLFISATMEYAATYMMGCIRARMNDADVIKSCCMYKMNNKKTGNIEEVSCVDMVYLIPIIKASNHRWAVFVDSKDVGKRYVEELGDDAVFLDSDRIKETGEASEEFKRIVEQETFTKKVLVTTSVLDSGVNFKDRNIKGVVLDVNSKVQLQQMLGRKRFLDDDDKIKIFIIHKSQAELKRSSGALLKKIRDFHENHRALKATGKAKQIVNDDTEMAKKYKKTIYYDGQLGCYLCNHIGLVDCQNKLNELKELQSADCFETKLRWLFGDGWKDVKIGMTMEEIMAERRLLFLQKMQEYVGCEFDRKSKENSDFQADITNTYRELFGLDEDEDHRTNRLLSYDKIQTIIEKLQLPIEIERPVEKNAKGKRRTVVKIKQKV